MGSGQVVNKLYNDWETMGVHYKERAMAELKIKETLKKDYKDNEIALLKNGKVFAIYYKKMLYHKI